MANSFNAPLTWANSRDYWGGGDGTAPANDNTPIVYPDVSKYTDYQISTASSIKTGAIAIGKKLDKIGNTITNDVVDIYGYAKYYPLVMMGASIFVLLSYSKSKKVSYARH